MSVFRKLKDWSLSSTKKESSSFYQLKPRLLQLEEKKKKKGHLMSCVQAGPHSLHFHKPRFKPSCSKRPCGECKAAKGSDHMAALGRLSFDTPGETQSSSPVGTRLSSLTSAQPHVFSTETQTDTPGHCILSD